MSAVRIGGDQIMGVIAVISVDFILASDDWHGPAELVDELLLAVAEHRCADVVGKRIASVNVDHGFVSLGCRCQGRSEEHTSELQSLMRISYAVFCLKKKKKHNIPD